MNVALSNIEIEMMYNRIFNGKKINVLHSCKLCKVYVEISQVIDISRYLNCKFLITSDVSVHLTSLKSVSRQKFSRL